MHKLTVHFYNPKNDKDGVWNKIVSYVDPPYCHCELEFADARSCAVYMGGVVHLKTRTFDPANYDSVMYHCSPQQHARALALAESLVESRQTFSNRCMLATKINVLAPAPGDNHTSVGNPMGQTTWPILKIGRYMATTMPPIRVPSTTMMMGSIRLDRPLTMSSTSSS